MDTDMWEVESPAAHLYPRHHDAPPVGTGASGVRIEADSLGTIEVPADRYWGAQTQRSLEHFAIGDERMPLALIHAYAQVKEAAAWANADLGALDDVRFHAIALACRDIHAGLLDDSFPLSVYQTGSGTHTNANLNEVIANRAIQLLGGELGSRKPVHPSNHVNMSQSTNDTFVTAMHVAAITALHEDVLPALSELGRELAGRANEWAMVPKPGRTHVMDATSLTVGQEWSGYVAALDAARRHVIASQHDLYEVALGGTAVGTGLNAPRGFAYQASVRLQDVTGYPFRPAGNAFSAQATIDAIVRSHASLKGVAVTLFKIANDLRWLSSGPHHGLHELVLPELEPGSSIMPGKVNPSQAEAMMMACLQVMGHDVVISQAGAEGNFELNTFRPVVINDYLRSTGLIADAARHFGHFLVSRVRLSDDVMSEFDDSVSLVTSLSRFIGYDRAATIAHSAAEHGVDVLAEAALNGVPRSIVDEVRLDAAQ